ncbi:MAG: AmpG family muropeptide MFS transporter [Bdellovibrionota bacterium]|nr:MAG: AmpG family muropeptide MFS transporter [Bdellovibrionota bacterium]
MSTVLSTLASRRIAVTLFLGFSSGLPFLAIGSTLQAWFTDAGLDLALIGALALVKIPYNFKFLWAPLIDRYTIPWLGRRRGWMVITQLLLAVLFAALALLNPGQHLALILCLAFLIAFVSATQDIVLDAHRRDSLHDEELGLGSSLFINGYRIGMLLAGAGALFVAQVVSWPAAYLMIGAAMVVGILTTLIAPEPPSSAHAPSTLRQAIVLPLKDFFVRIGVRQALVILLFILLYKLGDSLAATMTTPFILNIGYTKIQLASIAKTFGLAATIAGGLIGGVLMLRLGIAKSLWIFGVLQALSTLGFALLATRGVEPMTLTWVVAFENLASGMGTAAYAAFMASLCDRSFSATQYALLSSFMSIPGTFLAGFSGILAASVGWPIFFVVCTALAVPGMVLLCVIAPWRN